MTDARGDFNWSASLANSFYVTVDKRLRGALHSSEFRIFLEILTDQEEDQRIKAVFSALDEAQLRNLNKIWTDFGKE